MRDLQLQENVSELHAIFSFSALSGHRMLSDLNQTHEYQQRQYF